MKASGTSEALESAFDDSQGGSKSLTEPRPLAVPVQQTKIEDASERAKQAFSNSAQPSASDRYSNAAPPAREKSAPTGSSAVTNPFTASSAATPSAPPKSDRIEPLSPVPIHSDIPTHDSDQTHGLRQLEGAGTPTASSINRDTPTKAFIGQSPQQLNEPSPYNRTLAVPNSLGRNDDITPIATGEGTGKPGEKALEGPQQPTLVIQKFAPTEIQVGKTAKFVLQVRNAGAQTADGVTIHDEVPQGTKLISTSPNATTEGSHIVWQIGKLSPGEDRTVEMQLMPTTEGEIGSVATVSYAAQASVKPAARCPSWRSA